MDVLARGRPAVRTDLPLSLLRSMVFGPIEHVLWDAILGHRKLDTETTATQLVDMLWAAVQPPAPEQAALVRSGTKWRKPCGGWKATHAR